MLSPHRHLDQVGRDVASDEQRTPWREDSPVTPVLRQLSRVVPAPVPGPLVEGLDAAARGLTKVAGSSSPRQAPPLSSLPAAPRPFAVPSPPVAEPVPCAAVANAESCQHAVDTKAFTGRGEPREVRLAIGVVDKVHQQMDQLIAQAGGARKAQIYLTLHVRSTGQHSLRWRGYTAAAGHVHLSWDAAKARFAQQPYAQRAQLVAWDLQAKELNADEIKARLELKRARAAAAKQAATASRGAKR